MLKEQRLSLNLSRRFFVGVCEEEKRKKPRSSWAFLLAFWDQLTRYEAVLIWILRGKTFSDFGNLIVNNPSLNSASIPSRSICVAKSNARRNLPDLRSDLRIFSLDRETGQSTVRSHWLAIRFRSPPMQAWLLFVSSSSLPFYLGLSL